MLDIIISAIIGCLAGVTIMCCLVISGQEDDKDNDRKE